jgi:hypothetical protein
VGQPFRLRAKVLSETCGKTERHSKTSAQAANTGVGDCRYTRLQPRFLRIPGHNTNISETSQKRSLAQFEVLGLDVDRDPLRSLAKRLAEGPESPWLRESPLVRAASGRDSISTSRGNARTISGGTCEPLVRKKCSALCRRSDIFAVSAKSARLCGVRAFALPLSFRSASSNSRKLHTDCENALAIRATNILSDAIRAFSQYM